MRNRCVRHVLGVTKVACTVLVLYSTECSYTPCQRKVRGQFERQPQGSLLAFFPELLTYFGRAMRAAVSAAGAIPWPTGGPIPMPLTPAGCRLGHRTGGSVACHRLPAEPVNKAARSGSPSTESTWPRRSRPDVRVELLPAYFAQKCYEMARRWILAEIGVGGADVRPCDTLVALNDHHRIGEDRHPTALLSLQSTDCCSQFNGARPGSELGPLLRWHN